MAAVATSEPTPVSKKEKPIEVEEKVTQESPEVKEEFDDDEADNDEEDDHRGDEEDVDEEEYTEDIIDFDTFDQLLEMDDDESHEFSKSLVYGYFDQAEQTLDELDDSMLRLDFPDLTRLGHYLKGSSASLGLIRIKTSCERLQHYGKFRAADGVSIISNDEAGVLIQALLMRLRREYMEARTCLREFYGDDDDD